MPMSLATADILRRLKSKPRNTKGLPKRHSNPLRKAKIARYLWRSTCTACSLVFRSPKYQRAHVRSKHDSMVGVNRKRSC